MEKKTKIILCILVLLVACGAAIIFFMSPSSVMSDGDVVITDMSNRNVNISANPTKVVGTSPPMTTLIYMLAPDKLGGVNFEWTDQELEYVPDKYKNLPVIGGWMSSQDGNYEEFLAAEPDFVVESYEGMGSSLDNINEKQDKFGDVPVVAVADNTNVTKMDDTIEFMGKILDAEDKASELIAFNDKYLDIVEKTASSIPDSEKKTVYYGHGEDGLTTSGSGSEHSQLINLVGGKNVADGEVPDATEFSVSIEQIIKWNPDVIICDDQDFYDSIYQDSNWANINAVKNHQVYISPQSPFKWFDRPPGENIIIGVPWTAKVIYPDKYTDINLLDATKTFYSKFYHFDLDDNQAKDILISSGLKEGTF